MTKAEFLKDLKETLVEYSDPMYERGMLEDMIIVRLLSYINDKEINDLLPDWVIEEDEE